jgi:outer membrane protein assembly factor BamB
MKTLKTPATVFSIMALAAVPTCAAPADGVNGATGNIQPAVSRFATGGHTVYHLCPATVARGGGRVIISAAYHGAVLCHAPTGELRWKAETGGNFPFDLCVADINGDGLDEVLVASGDGVLYAIRPEGQRLWSFKTAPPLFQVCAAKHKDGKCMILTGGKGQILYALSPEGKLRGQLPLGIPLRVPMGSVRIVDLMQE